jgi:acyl-CoA reductase-like NAD-dependent aldehyde dehydrogenase
MKSSKPRMPKPRCRKRRVLAEVELPRTTNQLRQAAAAALEGSWALPTIDTKLNIRSTLAPLGPVLIFGPNNFPFAYNGIAGGDFAAAIAAGNPVIAKAHPSHPNTSRLLAEEAFAAVRETGLPAATGADDLQSLHRKMVCGWWLIIGWARWVSPAAAWRV